MLTGTALRTASNVVTLIILSGAGVACSGPPSARLLARETLQQAADYEESVKALSRAMSKYYEASVRDLEARLAVAQATERSARATRLAQDAAVAAIRRGGFRVADFRAFVEESMVVEADPAAPAIAALAQTRQRHKLLLEQVETQEKALKTLRAKLETLQTERSLDDVLADLKPIFDTAREVIENAKEKN
jgi:hypothetical protein